MAVTMIEQQPGCGPPAPVPILQWEAEFAVLLALYRLIAPSDVLEIGTYHGGTLYHWLQNSIADTHIVSVDSYAVGVDNRHLYDEWNVNGCDLRVIAGDSHDPSTVNAVGAYGQFDFVLIDAGHFYKEVKRDWELYRPMVRPGGLMCFHDILTHPAWPSIEVGQLWEQIKQDHLTFEIVADRNAEWGGIGVVLL
jgi:predicted O-methyltransferase YrrM